MDVQGVSISTTNSLYVKSVSLSTVSIMDVQDVSLTTHSSVDVKGLSLSTTLQSGAHRIGKHYTSKGIHRYFLRI
jgi:hypothetical protein